MAKVENKINANEFTDVKDIKRTFLYRTDGYILGYLRVFSYNIGLLSDEEKQTKTNVLAASFESDRKDWAYATYPREVDLDIYKNDLKRRYNQELASVGMRHILQEMILEATDLATSGENYEHQHFIKLWKYAGSNVQEAERELKTRLEEFKSRYDSVSIRTEILKESDIIKMCNLFGNSVQAPFLSVGNNTIYEQMTVLG